MYIVIDPGRAVWGPFENVTEAAAWAEKRWPGKGWKPVDEADPWDEFYSVQALHKPD